MKQGTSAPIHILRWASADWFSSPLRGQLALEGDHVTRLAYLELLFKLHENGGTLTRAEAPGALLLPSELSDVAINKLIASGRIQETDGVLSNPRITLELQKSEGFRDEQRERGQRGSPPGHAFRGNQHKRRGANGEVARATTGGNGEVARATTGGNGEVASGNQAVAVAVMPLPLPLPKPMPEPNNGLTDSAPSARAAEAQGTQAPKAPTVVAVKAEVVSWSRDACDIWNAKFGAGTAPGGRIGSALKGLVNRYGWETIKPAWVRYVEEKDGEFASPQDFAQKLGLWMQRRGSKNIDKSKAVIRRWLEKQGEAS